MKFSLTGLLISYFLILRVDAQCPIPNGDFEILGDLTDTLSAELDLQLKFPVTAPEGWIPLLRPVEIAFSEFIVEFFDKDTLDIDVFSGVESYIPGANGSEKSLFLAGDDLALVSDVIRFFPCSSRPEKVTWFMKYTGQAERDSLTVTVLLMNNPSLNVDDAIGVANFKSDGGPADFTKFEAEFTYSSDEVPDTAVVLIASERYDQWPGDSSGYVVDEITFEGGSVSIHNANIKEALLLGPNPVIDDIHIIGTQTNFSQIEIFDAFGRSILFLPSVTHKGLINLTEFAPGIYFAKLELAGKNYYQKLIKL